MKYHNTKHEEIQIMMQISRWIFPEGSCSLLEGTTLEQGQSVKQKKHE